MPNTSTKPNKPKFYASHLFIQNTEKNAHIWFKSMAKQSNEKKGTKKIK